MKKLFLFCCIALLILGISPSANAQYLDSNFTVAAQIKPSDYPGIWSDSTAAWRVYANYDLDNNGKKEFLVILDAYGSHMPTILRFEANGDNKYDLVWHAEIPQQNAAIGSWPCLTVADLDNDGNQEIIVGIPLDARTSTNENPDFIFFYEYDPVLKNFPTEPTMTSNLGFPAKTYYAITSIVVDDVDGDGEKELITSARRFSNNVQGIGDKRPLHVFHLLGEVAPGFSSLEVEFVDTLGTFAGGYYFNNHVVDFDGNGKKEIWGYTWDMLSFAVYEATGKDTYVLRTDVNQATNPDDYGEQNSVSFYDANGDGKLEMFVAGQVSPPSAVLYLPNTNDLTAITGQSVKMITPAFQDLNFQGADIGDIDGDGEVDFFIGDWDNTLRSVYHLSHIKGQPFDDPSGYKFDTLYYADTTKSYYAFPNVTFGNDLDGDGKREVILVNSNVNPDSNDVGLIILESKKSITGVKQISQSIPGMFSLEQNYPNPFNPSSTIRFSLKEAAQVKLVVTNMLGQEVASLVNSKLDAGQHEVMFNASKLSSGTYFYTIKAGNFVQTRKMVLMK
ncbi:MAG: T9SS type A sorting domain-containing protein [Bacteroidetes bacterium]|nr:T9SS type A sorting domain-containing protein [Bacteroidota bacterium]